MPEPFVPIAVGATVVLVPDSGKILAGLRNDIHNHESQQIAVALKFESEEECYLFNNQSYGYPRWSNPVWKLGLGRHRLRVKVFYDRGREETCFWLVNSGKTRNETYIESSS
jgi:hypothetical protein